MLKQPYRRTRVRGSKSKEPGEELEQRVLEEPHWGTGVKGSWSKEQG